MDVSAEAIANSRPPDRVEFTPWMPFFSDYFSEVLGLREYRYRVEIWETPGYYKPEEIKKDQSWILALDDDLDRPTFTAIWVPEYTVARKTPEYQ